jgi:hypothetical protein
MDQPDTVASTVYHETTRYFDAQRQHSGFEPAPRIDVCLDNQHNPPTHLYVPAGLRYRHVCPRCGATVFLESPEVTC